MASVVVYIYIYLYTSVVHVWKTTHKYFGTKHWQTIKSKHTHTHIYTRHQPLAIPTHTYTDIHSVYIQVYKRVYTFYRKVTHKQNYPALYLAIKY